MKRSVSLVLLAAACALALAAVTMLTGCGPKETDSGPTGNVTPDPGTDSLTGETASYTSGYVDLALTLPEGWKWEAVQNKSGGTEGVRFWSPEEKALDFRLQCWTKGFGMCGTGVTSEELTLPGGQTVWEYTEEGPEGLWLNICFVGTPGDYVLQPTGGTLDRDTWEACRDTLLAILDTARFGRNAMTEQQAIDAASATYDGQYDMAYGRYNVTDGKWTVTFNRSVVGQEQKSARFSVSADGKVSALPELPEVSEK